MKMFSKQLVHKASVVNLIDAHILDCYPNTEQWLQVVGLPSKTVKVSCAHTLSHNSHDKTILKVKSL